MIEIIDLSQEIYTGMPVFHKLPSVTVSVYATHEQWEGIADSEVQTPSVNNLEMSEHTGTHVDAISHMGRVHKAQSIEKLPLTTFFTEGICLDLSYAGLKTLIDVVDIKQAIAESGQTIKAGDTVLLYTDHYRRTFGTADWADGPGITAEAATWLGQQEIATFGVETMSPGVSGISNKQVHTICGELGFTHYENLINLHQLIGRGRFRFIGLPLKIRGGTGSPVRAIAVLE